MHERVELSWLSLPLAARIYVALVMVGGTLTCAVMFPITYPQPVLFGAVVTITCITSAWKVTLPLTVTSGSTLSVSSAAKLMALLLLGPGAAVVAAVAGALTQCMYKVRQRYPLYRTLFSMSAEAVAMGATGIVYTSLNPGSGLSDAAALAQPLVGAIATYFILDTGLVAAAIGLSTRRRVSAVWRDDFLLSGVTFMVAGTAGAVGAVIVDRGYHWLAMLLLAPLYLTYRTYELFMSRLADQQRHVSDMNRMHQETMNALSHAREAERALAEEKERLAGALGEMTRLEDARKDLLEREHAARSSAERANRLKDQFLAIVSHELRTPLNAILGWSDMLRSGKLEPERRDRAFVAIHDSAKRQAQLIDELLDVARIMSGKLRLERTFVDVDDVIRGAINIVQPQADAKGVQLTLDVDSTIGVIYADRARLQQIVWNLLSNAIKFTPHDGGAVQLRAMRSGDSIELVVTDDGQGIPADFIASLFEPFRQADGSTSRRHGGLGLGLSITKHLVDAHGGVIRAQSHGEGKGSVFTVWLPIAPASLDHVAVDVAEHPSPLGGSDPPTLEGLSVLVVDDDDEGRRVVAAQLEAHHASVLTAASASEALEILLRKRVDVLLADIGMPVEDGYSLIHRVRALQPVSVASIPAAALTAFARSEDRLQALEAGFQMHLAKPVEGQTLIGAVARLGGRLPKRHTRPGPVWSEPVTIQ